MQKEVFTHLWTLLSQRNHVAHTYGHAHLKVDWASVHHTVTVIYPELAQASTVAIEELGRNEKAKSQGRWRRKSSNRNRRFGESGERPQSEEGNDVGNLEGKETPEKAVVANDAGPWGDVNGWGSGQGGSVEEALVMEEGN